MLSKEEIENSFTKIEIICKQEVCLFNQTIIEGNLNQIKRYIIQLESDKQKLIEKLEEDKETLKKENADETLQDYVIKLLEIVKGEKHE